MTELEDYRWFPSVLRNFQTEFIGFVVARLNVYDAFDQHLKTLSLTVQPMADLCSGSGKPAISIFRSNNCFNQLTLGDKYPNSLKLHHDKIYYEPQSADVLAMEFRPGVYYTMFNAFHHFKDQEKLKIVQKILSSGSVAFIVEILEPNIICLLKVLFATTIGNLLLTPFIIPFSFKRLLFTYILPVNILVITFDGILSVLKSYSVKQYQRLFISYGDSIEVIRLRKGLKPLIIIQIQPKK